MNLHYHQTLIAVADDCPVTRSQAPARRGGKATVAGIQYDMMAGAPNVFTQPDVLFQSWLQRQSLPADLAADEVAQLRTEFFKKPQPCLRCSPLPKKHGFGLLFDREGRVSLCPMESPEYRRIADGQVAGVQVVKAMRSQRTATT